MSIGMIRERVILSAHQEAESPWLDGTARSHCFGITWHNDLDFA